jgi:hypothetical protein
MNYYFDESGDLGFKIEKGSSKDFSIAIIQENDTLSKLENLRKLSSVKNIYKWNKLNKKEKESLSDLLFKNLVTYTLVEKNKSKNKNSNILLINMLLKIISKIPENKIKIYYEGEHLKKVFSKVSKKSFKKVVFLEAKTKEEKIGVLLADLVAGSVRYKR